MDNNGLLQMQVADISARATAFIAAARLLEDYSHVVKALITENQLLHKQLAQYENMKLTEIKRSEPDQSAYTPTRQSPVGPCP